MQPAAIYDSWRSLDCGRSASTQIHHPLPPAGMQGPSSDYSHLAARITGLKQLCCRLTLCCFWPASVESLLSTIGSGRRGWAWQWCTGPHVLRCGNFHTLAYAKLPLRNKNCKFGAESICQDPLIGWVYIQFPSGCVAYLYTISNFFSLKHIFHFWVCRSLWKKSVMIW